MASITMVSLNTNGLRSEAKRIALHLWLDALKPDVICLQETHAVSLEEIRSWFGGFSCVASCHTRKSAGVAILYGPSLSLERAWNDAQGRVVQAQLSFQDSRFRVVSLYAPNRNPARTSFFNELSVSPSLSSDVPVIVAGDFNSVLDRALDRRGSDPNSSYSESSDAIQTLMTSLHCFDGWRHLHPSEQCFTWDKPDGSISSRIDLVLFPSPWIHLLSSCSIVPCPHSDHRATVTRFALPRTFATGPSYWKFNTSLLDDQQYMSSISTFWKQWQNERADFADIRLWWDVGKIKLRQLTMSFSKRRAREKRSERQSLTKELASLRLLIDQGHANHLPRLKQVESNLRELDLDDARGAQIRSRARWVEEGETSSSYFLRLERSRGLRQCISAVNDPDGRTVTDLSGIIDTWKSFYHQLFTAIPVDPQAQDSMLSRLEGHLSEAEAASCEGPLKPDEALVALKGMSRGKAPGYDGLPMEFYLAFWPVIGRDLVEVLNIGYQNQELSISQRRGVITLIFKKDNPLLMKNWRPISLLNVDYKIATRCMAARLLRVIGSVVAEDQTCGIPGRFIGTNVSLLRDIVSYATDQDIPLAILSLDQEKAFDRVDWSFLHRTLESMGFGPSFRTWVRVFYSDISSAVLVNGYLSEFFGLTRGVRQGCPLSALLYVLVSEVLACSIRSSTEIRGLALPTDPSRRAVVSQYADDTSIVCTTNESITATFDVYDQYESASGAKLNASKSKGLWLGPWRHRTDPPVSLRWSSSRLPTLGTVIGPDVTEIENFQPRIDALQNVLNSWRQRQLSFRGKALVVNALALSGLWYVVSCLAVPSWVIAAVNKEIYSFLWSNKKELVSRNAIHQPTAEGGLGFPSFQLRIPAFHVQWIKRLADHTDAKWKSFFQFFLRRSLPAGFLRKPTRIKDAPLLPAFHKSVLNAWAALKGGAARHSDDLQYGLPDSPAPVSGLTVKTAYQFLGAKEAKPPHCVGKFSPVYPEVVWPAAWQQVHCCSIDRQATDLAWKIAHGVLYTADRLVGFGLQNIEPACFCGHGLETIPHLFFHCPLAQNVLRWVQSLLDSALPNPPVLVVRHVLYGFDRTDHVPPVFTYLLHLSKYYIWLARNDFRFRDESPFDANIIASIKGRARFILPILFKRTRSGSSQRLFESKWGGNGLVGRRAPGLFIVSL